MSWSTIRNLFAGEVLHLCAFCVAARGLERGDSEWRRVYAYKVERDCVHRLDMNAGACSDCEADVAERETWRKG